MRDWRGALHDMREPFTAARFQYGRFALTLMIGLVGALAFSWLQLPLPWMLGPMLICTAAAIGGLPVSAPAVIRPPMMVVLGFLLGSGFSPEIASGIGGWIPTLFGVVLFVGVAGLACVTYFRKVAGLDLTTAYFAGMPGGLVEMVLLGQEKNGDARIIALVHSIRILLIVSSLPLVILLFGGTTLGARPSAGIPLSQTPPDAFVWLVVVGLLGAFLGLRLRLPAPYLLGPMVISGLVHLFGWTHAALPRELVWIAQLVLGVTLGCRFVGTPLRTIGRMFVMSLGSVLILIATTLVFAFSLGSITGLNVVTLLLAYSPGGLTETSLVALALQIDVAFVATHHIFRVFLVMAAAGPIFKFLEPVAVAPSDEAESGNLLATEADM